jgi:hypothetical protein
MSRNSPDLRGFIAQRILCTNYEKTRIREVEDLNGHSLLAMHDEPVTCSNRNICNSAPLSRKTHSGRPSCRHPRRTDCQWRAHGCRQERETRRYLTVSTAAVTDRVRDRPRRSRNLRRARRDVRARGEGRMRGFRRKSVTLELKNGIFWSCCAHNFNSCALECELRVEKHG